MATISVSGIAGFEEMTDAQKLEAVLALEIPDEVDMSQYVSKSSFDKKASELAEANRKLKEKMGDDERKKAEEAENLKNLQDQLEKLQSANDELVKNNKIAEFTSKYLALGYDKELASDTAKAMVDGDFQKVFDNGEKHKEALEKKMKEDIINGTKKPGGNGGADGGEEKDSAVEKAKEIAGRKTGNGKAYEDIIKNYR